MDELFECDAVDLAGHIESGAVSPEEILGASIARAERINPKIDAIVHFGKERAGQLAAETPKGAPFRGVPTLIKDLGIETADFPSSLGSRLFRDTVYDYESAIYRRIREAGFVPYARTTSPELGIGPVSEAGVYGKPTRNPWNTDHTSGGSSGGSGAAVAAGIVPLAHGSDGGGSVRIPASCCGLVGLKPTRARLPDGPAAGEGWAGMSIDGFLTRSVRDTAMALDLCHGADPGAPYHAPPLKRGFAKSMAKPPGKLRIAVMETDFTGNAVDPECLAAVTEASRILSSLGHDARPWKSTVGDRVTGMMLAWTGIVAAGTMLSVRAKVDIETLEPDMVDGVTYGAVQMGREVGGADYLKAVNTIHAFGRAMAAVFEDFDVLVSPTLAEPPARIGRFKPVNTDFMDYRNGPQGVFRYSPYTAVFNASGQPAISLPLHWGRGELPVGVQFAAAFGEDELLVSLAAQVEAAAPWRGRQLDLIRSLHA